MLIIDNIFLIFYFLILLVEGVDIVLYLVMKYIGGYNDVLVGVVIVKGELFV